VRMIRRRGLLVVVAFCISILSIGSGSAQDPRGSIAQNEARSWLAMTDRGDGAASWSAAGKKFQTAITADRWEESLRSVRPPLGALIERTMMSTQFMKNIPGAPDGDYVVLEFRSTFAHKTDSRETITLEHEADGAWRVIGYFIH
jgi:Protein of unknown function (DUF4019)